MNANNGNAGIGGNSACNNGYNGSDILQLLWASQNQQQQQKQQQTVPYPALNNNATMSTTMIPLPPPQLAPPLSPEMLAYYVQMLYQQQQQQQGQANNAQLPSVPAAVHAKPSKMKNNSSSNNNNSANIEQSRQQYVQSQVLQDLNVDNVPLRSIYQSVPPALSSMSQPFPVMLSAVPLGVQSSNSSSVYSDQKGPQSEDVDGDDKSGTLDNYMRLIQQRGIVSNSNVSISPRSRTGSFIHSTTSTSTSNAPGNGASTRSNSSSSAATTSARFENVTASFRSNNSAADDLSDDDDKVSSTTAVEMLLNLVRK